MTNKDRQPTVSKAVGNPNKGKPASVIAVVGKSGNDLDATKGVEETGNVHYGDES